jgi:hypothetical protein
MGINWVLDERRWVFSYNSYQSYSHNLNTNIDLIDLDICLLKQNFYWFEQWTKNS